MPEGPECLTMADMFYDNNFVTKKLLKIKVQNGRYKTHGISEDWENFNEKLPMKLLDVHVKGKMMYFEFPDENYMICNLGLTGYWATKEHDKKANIVLKFDESTAMYYYDDTSFGTLRFVDSDEKMNVLLDKLGPDILQNPPSLSKFKGILAKKKNQNKMIVVVISDQSNIAGIGNYLRSEILYAAKISPKTLVSEMTDDEIKKVHKYCIKIPEKSYTANGSDSYINDGSYIMKVYRQKVDPDGNSIKSFVVNRQKVYHVI